MYKQFTTDILHLPTFTLNDEGKRVKNGWILGVEPKPQSHLCPLCFQESINHARTKERILRHAWVSTQETIYIRIMDEFAHKRGHTYSVALQDAHTGHVWQTHPGKSRACIQEGLRRYPFQAPEVIVTDLVPGMAQTVHEIWPETAIVVDKFHVIQLFTQALDRARKLEGTNGASHKTIRHQRRLLMSHPKHLKKEEKENLRLWLGENPELKKQWVALQKFRDVYRAKSYKKAQKALEDWCSHYLFEGANATKSIAKTILKWKQEILNHFTYKLTNARLEGTNNLIKTLKRRSYGCPNMYHFDLRIRMECRPPA